MYTRLTLHVRPGLLAGALLLFAVLWMGCRQGTGEGAGYEDVYEYRASQFPEGTGKYYMGREISQVMGHVGADWLERPSRESQELPDRLINVLRLRPTDVVADIGAGTGYLTFRISPRVPYGRVMAVDIQEEMLEMIRQRQEDLGITNVETVRGTIEDPNLPASTVDVALLVDAYHEFSHPYEMMTNIVASLKPGGRLVLVEYRGEDPTLPIRPLHRMSQEQAQREMENVGLLYRETLNILPQQHVMIFEKPLGGVTNEE